MKQIKVFLTSGTISISIVVVALMILAYVYSVAGDVIDRSILGLANVLGYGITILAVVTILCSVVVFLAVTLNISGGQYFGFVIRKSQARNELLKSEFQFQVLEEGQQGFLFSRPDSNLVGRPVSLEAGPFTSNSLPSQNPVDLAKWQLLNAPKQTHQGAADGLLGPGTKETNDSLIFEDVARKALSSRGAGRFIVFGEMDSGKTTVAKHVVNYAIDEIVNKRQGQIYVIDPHAPKTAWSDDVMVIGAGLDYKSIANFLQWLIADVKERYELGCGDDSQPLPKPPVFIVCEEWAGVIAELRAKKKWTEEHNRTFYMDARKAGIGYFLVSHEHTVGALGLQGMGNLLNGVEYFLTLNKNAITDKFSATLGRSFKDKQPFDLVTPGPYNGRLHYSKREITAERQNTEKYVVYDQPATISDPETNRAGDIRALHSQGLSNQEIAVHFGKTSCSGKFYYEVKSALNGDA